MEFVNEVMKIHGLCTTETEVRRLMELAQNAEFIVEIGAYMGRTTKALSITKGIVFSVDTWLGSEEDKDGEKTKEVPMEEVYLAYLKNLWSEITSGKVCHLRMDSVNAAQLLGSLGYTFDLIFIDAGHDYEWVTRDIQAWKPLLDKGGMMVGHDLPHPRMAEALNDNLKGWQPSVDMLWEWHNE